MHGKRERARLSSNDEHIGDDVDDAEGLRHIVGNWMPRRPDGFLTGGEKRKSWTVRIFLMSVFTNQEKENEKVNLNDRCEQEWRVQFKRKP
ncbi:unnamed protein product [Angiostrongylus costaricensis]|uniref:Uncharacterized protein n=1 Tax=Angiostrongylus costaricensis TaxID=334426 RepID=A0A0R3PYT7_ANGCS|nr:unnamed protein product [Angiostrongylus costaricensis]